MEERKVREKEKITAGKKEKKDIFHISNFKVTIYIQIDGTINPSRNVIYIAI
jgi:hypothetical protein